MDTGRFMVVKFGISDLMDSNIWRTWLGQGKLPDKIMINVHPQRWHDAPLPWVKAPVKFATLILRIFHQVKQRKRFNPAGGVKIEGLGNPKSDVRGQRSEVGE
jgi:hypothetical protein